MTTKPHRPTWENVARALAAVLVLACGAWLATIGKDLAAIRDAHADTVSDVAVLRQQAKRGEQLEEKVDRIDRNVTKILIHLNVKP